MLKKILVAYDNGIKSQKALNIAIELAKCCKGEIYLFTSVKMPDFVMSVADRGMLQKLEDQSHEYFDEILKEAEEKVKAEGVPVHKVIRHERPGEAIISFAEKEKMDLISMGSNNRGPFERILLGLGSVSNYVLQHAKCPVLINRE